MNSTSIHHIQYHIQWWEDQSCYHPKWLALHLFPEWILMDDICLIAFQNTSLVIKPGNGTNPPCLITFRQKLALSSGISHLKLVWFGAILLIWAGFYGLCIRPNPKGDVDGMLLDALVAHIDHQCRSEALHGRPTGWVCRWSTLW